MGMGFHHTQEVKIWNILTGKNISTIDYFSKPNSWYTSIGWNHINDMLAVATVTGSVRSVTILLNSKQKMSFDVLGIQPKGFHLAWNPVDATALATAGGNRIQVWEVLPTVTVTDVMQREWCCSSALFCLLTY